MINAVIVGRLGRDPEQRTSGDLDIVNFSLGCNVGKDETNWVNCVVFGKRGQAVLDYFHKGDQVTVSGRMKLEEYEKKDGGGTAQSLSLVVNDFSLPVRAKEETVATKPVLSDVPDF